MFINFDFLRISAVGENFLKLTAILFILIFIIINNTVDLELYMYSFNLIIIF